jgi:hypothetical protein
MPLFPLAENESLRYSYDDITAHHIFHVNSGRSWDEVPSKVFAR